MTQGKLRRLSVSVVRICSHTAGASLQGLRHDCADRANQFLRAEKIDVLPEIGGTGVLTLVSILLASTPAGKCRVCHEQRNRSIAAALRRIGLCDAYMQCKPGDWDSRPRVSSVWVPGVVALLTARSIHCLPPSFKPFRASAFVTTIVFQVVIFRDESTDEYFPRPRVYAEVGGRSAEDPSEARVRRLSPSPASIGWGPQVFGSSSLGHPPDCPWPGFVCGDTSSRSKTPKDALPIHSAQICCVSWY